MLNRVEDRLELYSERLIADSVYGSSPTPGLLVDRNIAPHIPVIDKSEQIDSA